MSKQRRLTLSILFSLLIAVIVLFLIYLGGYNFDKRSPELPAFLIFTFAISAAFGTAFYSSFPSDK